MTWIAHSANSAGSTHSLSEHLLRVAEKMRDFSVNTGFESIFYFTGLLHDVGKYQPAFQKYLKEGGRRGSVPHASWGATLSTKYNHFEAAFAIDGHHKGLPDRGELKSDLSEIENHAHSVFSSIQSTFLNDLNLDESDLRYKDTGLRGTDKELFIRLLFSALTDADWLDTESHFNIAVSERRYGRTLDTSFLIEKLSQEINNKNKDGIINQLRNKVREYALSKAGTEPGFFSMALPTGMGKTLTSVSWALQHAQYNDMKRIIIVLPFISIIDQTAQELKRIFGDEWVLEHHSNFNVNQETDNNIADETIQDAHYTKRLAIENWDFPVIVTTSVQFFESLFGNKPTQCRKVHNIAKSVVIFDEIQTLPKEMVMPTLSMLKSVQKVMGTTFLFCTATQPAFEKYEEFDGIENIQSLVENTREVYDITRRVEYFSIENYQPVTIDKLCDKVLQQNESALCIFNTKKQTLLFFNTLKNRTTDKTYHLSTGMFPAHRKEVIRKIRISLNNNVKILVSSTQLIEAGVDFDFPTVYREIAPLESIIQSAGRCNREGKMNNPGKVYIFSLMDSGAPDKQYRSLAEFANSLYKGKEHLLFDHDFYKDYYRKILKLFIDADKKKIEDARKVFNFKSVAQSYRLIENNTTPVFVYCEASKTLYERIRYKPVLSREDYREMQQYSVQIYDNFLKENIDKLGKEEQGYWKWFGDYNNESGISTDSPVLIL
ncbi:MAG TPA: CRISPR-associated helicase Cas3' [Bacteroidales bacterium]|jgi:CRISPR-associated endonuclease/helicase Cas3|nr:CRISPR-associated helicase Cas3' [Bacteroidales bacterium]HOS71388.1 CRISPR-associated helicase Cas3' [Bacteroidales bacterium]HQH25254.1 CRISPR-associated helicase Cas3' [Bacteroidales bacterium]HQJ82805.1 CRISPR-associated helicase Cas3' [Bacteroidales bacterium]